MRKKIVILGSTGSIGCSTLQVVQSLNEEIEVVGLAGNRQLSKLASQVLEVNAKYAVCAKEKDADKLKELIGDDTQILAGNAGLLELVRLDEVDMVLCAIVGIAGLEPVLEAIRHGKDIALASKEIMVMAGELVMAEARKYGVNILPVDSEHSAIFQCLQGEDDKFLNRIILTASGGPFRNATWKELEQVTVAQALKHPTWSMGKKITIDSATLMNKGLELIEAFWLFNLKIEQIEVMIHPQSIVHSMVEFIDSSTIAQLSTPDMCLPIQYALTFPKRLANSITAKLDFSQSFNLTFEPPNNDYFPALELAKEALLEGGTLPATFNAANEVAVDAFCAEKISFLDISKVVEKTLDAQPLRNYENLTDIIAADYKARELANNFCKNMEF